MTRFIILTQLISVPKPTYITVYLLFMEPYTELRMDFETYYSSP